MSAAVELGESEVSPSLLVDAMIAYGKTAAIKAAIELDLFTMIGSGDRTAEALVATAGGSERGFRTLCDYLVVKGFLTKSGQIYALTPSSEVFLDRRSPAYMGAAIEFMAAPEMVSLFLGDPVAYVRNGGALGLANIAADNPVWVKFARGMGAFTGGSAAGVAAEIKAWPSPPKKVLDIAAGPGGFGIEIAKAVPSARIVALDWASVLALTKENASKAGVADRFSFIPGSAFEVDWGEDYDLILLPNFLHHFDAETCVDLLKKARASLGAGGKVLAVEFVPNEDRVSPDFPAGFSWVMLATTPKGDAYTKSELEEMGRGAGFGDMVTKELLPSPATMITFE